MLTTRARRELAIQRFVGRILSPLLVYSAVGVLRFGLRLRLADPVETRARYRELRSAGSGPLLICGNHLTMIDSALIAWALVGPGAYVRDYALLPWNVPERTNFAASPLQRVLAYLYKCLPIARGGSRAKVAETLSRFSYVVSAGDVGLIFPEGGRSRSGRVEVETAAWGVGRVLKSIPGCRLLCIYLRGDRQEGYSDLPMRGDRLEVSMSMLEPKSDHGGVRGSLDIARQIVSRLAEMEHEYLDAR